MLIVCSEYRPDQEALLKVTDRSFHFIKVPGGVSDSMEVTRMKIDEYCHRRYAPNSELLPGPSNLRARTKVIGWMDFAETLMLVSIHVQQ